MIVFRIKANHRKIDDTFPKTFIPDTQNLFKEIYVVNYYCNQVQTFLESEYL